MGQLPPGEWHIPNPGKLVDRQITMQNDNSVTIVATYDDGTVITATMSESGIPSIHINKNCLVDEATRTITVVKN